MILWLLVLILFAAVARIWLKVFPLKPSQQEDLDEVEEKVRLQIDRAIDRALEAYKREQAR